MQKDSGNHLLGGSTLQPSSEQRKLMQQEQETQYMLAELGINSESLSKQIERFEQIATLYLTGATAIVGALVIISTSTPAGQFNSLAFALTLLAFASFGTGIFLRMCVSKVGIVAAYARVQSIRLYFVKHFPETAHYTENISLTDLYHIWKRGAFSKQVLSLFAIMNLISGLCLSLGLGIMLTQLPTIVVLPPFAPLFVIVFSLIIFFLFEFSLWLYTRSQLDRARRLNQEVLHFAVEQGSSENT